MSYTYRIIEAVQWLAKEYKRIERKYQNPRENIILGRKFALGSMFQYVFSSKVLCDPTNTVLVDYPIKIAGRRQPLYPDILVIRDDILLAALETKIDLGFIRLESYGISYTKSDRKYSYALNKNGFKEKYRSLLEAGTFEYGVGRPEKKIHVKIGPTVRKICIVVSEANHPKRTPLFKRAMQDAGFVPIFLLDKSLHPGDYRTTNERIKNEIALKKNIIETTFDGL